MNHMQSFVIKLFLGLLLLYISASFYLYLVQKKAIYFPDSQDFNSCQSFSEAKKIDLGGTRAYFKRSSDKVVVIYHGNAGSACDRAFLKETFEKKGYSYLFVEYAGYSNDDEKPSRNLLLKDAKNIKDFIQAQKFDKVVLFGESLGTGIASYHQLLSRPDSIILIEPFDSILEFAKGKYPFFPIKLILTENLDNKSWLENFPGNITIIHGTKDDIMPIARAQSLFDNLKSKEKNFVGIEGAGHNDIYGSPKTIKAIEEALE